MMQKAGQYKVSIFGENYTIRSDESPDLIVQAADLVDSTMKEIANNTHFDAKSIAVLTALRFAHQIHSYGMQQGKGESLVDLIDKELELLGLAQHDNAPL